MTAEQFLKDKGIKDTIYGGMPDVWIKGGLSKLIDEYHKHESLEFAKWLNINFNPFSREEPKRFTEHLQDYQELNSHKK